MSDSDMHAYERFVRDNYRDVYRFLYSKTHSVSDAEDLTQESFLRYTRSTATTELTSKGRAYLFTIARNIAVDFYRSRKPQPEQLTAALEETLCAEEPPVDGFDELVEGLPEENIEILSLRYAQGFSINEIASITQQSRFAVRRRINASLSALRAARKEGTE